jgi:hypothetical protein
LPGCEPFGELLQVGAADSGQGRVGQLVDELGARGAGIGIQERAEGLGSGEADRGRAAGVAVVSEGFMGLLDSVADAGGGDLQEVGQHVHAGHLPLVEQRERQVCGIVESALLWRLPVARRARPPRWSLWLLGPGGLGRGECGGQTFQLRAGHAGQPWVGQLLEHGLAALGETARLTDVCRLSGAGGELGWRV